MATNVSDEATVTFELDTAADTPTLTFTDSSNGSDITNSDTITVGNLETNATWAYEVDNDDNWITGNGTSFTATNDGNSHTYTVRQTDVATNISDEADTVSFTLDTTKPVTPTLSLSLIHI